MVLIGHLRTRVHPVGRILVALDALAVFGSVAIKGKPYFDFCEFACSVPCSWRLRLPLACCAGPLSYWATGANINAVPDVWHSA
jgi:hypothetical protein